MVFEACQPKLASYIRGAGASGIVAYTEVGGLALILVTERPDFWLRDVPSEAAVNTSLYA